MNTHLNIMDVTCRDGSYVNNFQISLMDQKNICTALDKLGYDYTEIGHGMGVGAYRSRKSLHTDEEYLSNACKYLKKIKYGVFCIPGIAEVDDIRLAADFGCSFIRIGCNVEDIDKTESYIKEAKRLGLFVMSNYMKSYASSVEEFQEAVKKSESWGSEVVYIVDSAGGMLPDDIEKYFNAIKSVSSIKVGFHGHNNIGMALTNSLYAVDLGVDFVDCSLQGLGRSSGNASLEYLTICLQKKGYELGINEIELLLASKKYVFPLVKNKGIDPIDVECGIAGFHSSYLQSVHKISAKYGVNPLVLIKEYCKQDQINVDEKIMESIASKLKIDGDFSLDFQNYFGGEQ